VNILLGKIKYVMIRPIAIPNSPGTLISGLNSEKKMNGGERCIYIITENADPTWQHQYNASMHPLQ
jgi:hypothetical protein